MVLVFLFGIVLILNVLELEFMFGVVMLILDFS